MTFEIGISTDAKAACPAAMLASITGCSRNPLKFASKISFDCLKRG
ncbi:hypothetical protein [Mesorhizobium sp. B2-1-3A]|nr:hypothetical protein [Mesorhizobium sp. B2-1-3A]